MNQEVCLVTGVGPATGTAIVKRFAGMYKVAMVARDDDRLKELENSVKNTYPYPCDLSNLEHLEETLGQIKRDLGAPSIVIHNAVYGQFSTFLQTSIKQFELAFRVNTTAFLRLCQLVAPSMLEHQRGVILTTGNTAAYRGVPNFAGFAPSKAATRILSESIARTLGPQGIHVGFIAIDAVISTPRQLKAMPDKPMDYFAHPEDIAEHVWQVAHQPKSAWSFDTVIRPFAESW